MDTREKLHAWLLSIDENLLVYEEDLFDGNYINPKRLHSFDAEDADNMGMTASQKEIILEAIQKLPKTLAWP